MGITGIRLLTLVAVSIASPLFIFPILFLHPPIGTGILIYSLELCKNSEDSVSGMLASIFAFLLAKEFFRDILPQIKTFDTKVN